MNLSRAARCARRSACLSVITVAVFPLLSLPREAVASETGQGTFHVTLVPGVGCGPGDTTVIDYNSTFQFDDKTFVLNVPGEGNVDINLSELGTFQSSGQIVCVFDEGGTFTSTAVNEAGDFEWIGLAGEYLDRKPGISEGDPFPWVAGASCRTTRTDEFAKLCENFELSWNGLGKALAPTGGYNDFAGDLNVRTAARGRVEPHAEGESQPVEAPVTVDGPGGDVPDVEVRFGSGVLGEGEVSVVTLADAHGEVPNGSTFPVRGTTEIDHGSGAVAFFEGGDERFLDIRATAPMPSSSRLEVCVPLPEVASASDARPTKLLHGEGEGFSRRFVDRTSRIEHASGKICGEVSSLAKFAVVTTDACGSGKGSTDGILSVAGGLAGRKTVIVDGVKDCADLPGDLPDSLAQHCVPDADDTPGQCSVALTFGVWRNGCNRVAAGDDPVSAGVNRYSFAGSLRGKSVEYDLTSMLRSAFYDLPYEPEGTVGPVVLALPSYAAVSKFKLTGEMEGAEAGTGRLSRDRDTYTILCLWP